MHDIARLRNRAEANRVSRDPSRDKRRDIIKAFFPTLSTFGKEVWEKLDGTPAFTTVLKGMPSPVAPDLEEVAVKMMETEASPPRNFKPTSNSLYALQKDSLDGQSGKDEESQHCSPPKRKVRGNLEETQNRGKRLKGNPTVIGKEMAASSKISTVNPLYHRNMSNNHSDMVALQKGEPNYAAEDGSTAQRTQSIEGLRKTNALHSDSLRQGMLQHSSRFNPSSGARDSIIPSSSMNEIQRQILLEQLIGRNPSASSSILPPYHHLSPDPNALDQLVRLNYPPSGLDQSTRNAVHQQHQRELSMQQGSYPSTMGLHSIGPLGVHQLSLSNIAQNLNFPQPVLHNQSNFASLLRNQDTLSSMFQRPNMSQQFYHSFHDGDHLGMKNPSGLDSAGLNPSRASPSSLAAVLSSVPQTAAPNAYYMRDFRHEAAKSSLDLPPCHDGGPIPPYTVRRTFPLGIDEDPNWLSEFHCFVRSELLEVFRASREDVQSRNNSILHLQVGIRCKFCAHLTPAARSGRSCAFPSSLRQVYQSFTMMLRDHFGDCGAMPPQILSRFRELKEKPSQGATDSKRYWIYSAMKLGLADSSDGITVSNESVAASVNALPFGVDPRDINTGNAWGIPGMPVLLVQPSDRAVTPDFLYSILSQAQIVHLSEGECIGNRRSLPVGLPGFGCKYCCQRKRLGLCRMFPARRRTLPSKVKDLYDHLRRCTLCPAAVKEQLELVKDKMEHSFESENHAFKECFDRLWSHLGEHGRTPEFP